MTKKELAAKYNITTAMLRDWCRPISDKVEYGRKRMFKPREIKIIVEHLGEW